MRFEVKTAKAQQHKTDIAVVAVFADGEPGIAAKALDKAGGGLISEVLTAGDIGGKPGELLLLANTNDLPCRRILLVGCGPKADFDRKAYRKALAGAFGWLKRKPYISATLYFGHESIRQADAFRVACVAGEEWHKASYSFTQLKSSSDESPAKLATITLAVKTAKAASAARKGAKQGDALGLGMNFMRDLANLPGNVCTPSYLVKEARALAKSTRNLKVKALSEADMKKLGMGSLLSVTAGSTEPARFLILEYTGGAASRKPVVLVGKGITFDTGGISLKPPPTMDEMKFDMSGAASVMGVFRSLAELQPKMNVVGLIPTCENMPSGTATKPGDIVTSMSGQTIEILNTDAEGRLILCDALTYARRYEPEAVIDIATLTGACVIALGKHHCGLMSHSDSLANKLMAAGVAADDRAWRLPLTEEYSQQLKSNFADMANIGGREAGTITAGAFLANFTDGMNWAHLDIAGTAYVGGTAKGSTGRPVPLLLEYLLNR
jgi:leucyl aminopeptidase